MADDGTTEGSVKLETAQCFKKSNEQTYILSLTYLISSNCSLVCTNQNVFISCGEKKFNTNIFLNLESNNEIDIEHTKLYAGYGCLVLEIYLKDED